MRKCSKDLLRLAVKAHTGLTNGRRDRNLHEVLYRMTDRLEFLAGYARRISRCTDRGWHLAGQRLAEQLRSQLYDLTIDLAVCRDEANRPPQPPPTLASLYAEMQQAVREFGDIAYHPEENSVSVTTEPIVLEHVSLGPFEIRLRLEHLGDGDYGRAIRIVALDPNPAAANEAVTHPHVSDERLCPGDAGAALNSALAGGRLCDVLQIVQSVLSTYNAESPYVALENWNGRSCPECDYVMGDEDGYRCEACEEDVCDECTVSCAGCHDLFCKGCVTSCPLCGDNLCARCVDACKECGQTACTGCLDEGLCPTCIEKREDNDENEESTSLRGDAIEVQARPEQGSDSPREANSSDRPGSALHADGVGQAAVLLPVRGDGDWGFRHRAAG